jgi:hypothetical protein
MGKIHNSIKFSRFVAECVIALREAEYKGKQVALDSPFRLQDDPDYTHGVYVQGDGVEDVKYIRFGKRETKEKEKPDNNTDKTSSSYWEKRLVRKRD